VVITGRTYEDLELWPRSMDLVVECYQATSDTRRLLDRTGEVGRLMNGLLRYLRSHRQPIFGIPDPTVRLRRQPTSDLRNPTA
jgi:hypothetical protein